MRWGDTICSNSQQRFGAGGEPDAQAGRVGWGSPPLPGPQRLTPQLQLRGPFLLPFECAERGLAPRLCPFLSLEPPSSPGSSCPCPPLSRTSPDPPRCFTHPSLVHSMPPFFFLAVSALEHATYLPFPTSLLLRPNVGSEPRSVSRAQQVLSKAEPVAGLRGSRHY